MEMAGVLVPRALVSDVNFDPPHATNVEAYVARVGRVRHSSKSDNETKAKDVVKAVNSRSCTISHIN